MKRRLSRLIALICAVVILTQNAGAVSALPYGDVASDRWSYASIKTLYDIGVFPQQDAFKPTETETRGNFVMYLYLLAQRLGADTSAATQNPFADVTADDPWYEACVWAYRNNIVKGVNANSFSPQSYIMRQDVCVIMLRFIRYLKLSVAKAAEPTLFVDAFKISGYARTPVIACRMMGLIDGYSNGFFRPSGNISREECAAVICRLYRAANKKPSEGTALVETREGAYDSLYRTVTGFPTTLSLSGEISAEYFSDAVFVGDSVSVMLQYYCTATKALGGAKFLCAGSLSATNALNDVTQSSVHPSYQGKKMKVEDGVAACGAKKVYIMLGINNISYGLSKSTGDMVKLINRIKEKSPNVTIFVQSVTPMSEKSSIRSERLNNSTIAAYNQKMEEICAENGWYFVNVAEAFRNSGGCLPQEYCSDYTGMGIHFTNKAAEHWVSYLKTHALVS